MTGDRETRLRYFGLLTMKLNSKQISSLTSYVIFIPSKDSLKSILRRECDMAFNSFGLFELRIPQPLFIIIPVFNELSRQVEMKFCSLTCFRNPEIVYFFEFKDTVCLSDNKITTKEVASITSDIKTGQIIWRTAMVYADGVASKTLSNFAGKPFPYILKEVYTKACPLFLKSLEILEYVVLLILSHTFHNATLENFDGDDYGFTRHDTTVVKIDQATWRMDNSDFEINLLDSQQLETISCYHKPIYRLDMYSNPFTKELWGFLLLSLIGVSLFLLVVKFVKVKYLPFASYKLLQPVIFYSSIYIDQGFTVPSEVEQDLVFRLGLIFYLIGSIIFSNCYKSLVILGLNAPMRGVNVESLDEVLQTDLNFSAMTLNELAEVALEMDLTWAHFNHTKTNMSPGEITEILSSDYPKNSTTLLLANQVWDEVFKAYHDKNSFALLSDPAETLPSFVMNSNVSTIDSLYTLLNMIDNIIQRYRRMYTKENMKELAHILKFYSVKQRKYPLPLNLYTNHSIPLYIYRQTAIENELSVCEKSVYFTRERNTQEEMNYLQENYPNRYFYKIVTETRLIERLMLSFRKQANSRLPKILLYLIQSGIYGLLKGREKKVEYLARRHGTKAIWLSRYVNETDEIVRPLLISDSINTVFLIFLIFIATTTAALFSEKLISSRLSFAMILRYSCQKFINRVLKVTGLVLLFHKLQIWSLQVLKYIRSRKL